MLEIGVERSACFGQASERRRARIGGGAQRLDRVACHGHEGVEQLLFATAHHDGPALPRSERMAAEKPLVVGDRAAERSEAAIAAVDQHAQVLNKL